MSDRQIRLITILTILLVVFLSIASFFGSFIDITYARDTPSMAAQGIGQDIVDLFIVVPAIIISLILMIRKNRIATLVFGGLIFYVLYSFIIYSFGVHFNVLFLVYCLTLGTASYVFIFYISNLSRINVKEWYGQRTPNRGLAILFITVAAMFYMLWLKDVLPAIINNTIPKTVSDFDLLVNPVHVIDISFALPGLIITAILLYKDYNMGYILAPTALVFIIILTISLAAMVVMTRIKGISEDLSVAIIFFVLSLVSIVFLWAFMKSINSSDTN